MNEGIRLFNQKRYDRALQAFLNVKADPSAFPELSYYLGLCYTHLGKFDEALLYLEQVVTSGLSFPHIYQSRMILGYIYSVTGRYRLAEFEFRRVLDDGFESPKVYAALGYVFYAQGKTDDAVHVLETAIKMDPKNANALNSLGYVLAETGGSLERASRCCERAVKLVPQSAAYQDSLGWVKAKMGHIEEARTYLRKALELAPGNKEIAAHLKHVMNTGGR